MISAALGDDADGNAEVFGGTGDEASDVACRAEPKGSPIGEAGGQGLTDEPSGTAVVRSDAGSLVEQGSATKSTSGWGKRMVSRSVGLGVANRSES